MQTKKAPENLRFATKFHENRPVKIADRTFWSKRLNGEEEMLLEHVNMASIGTSGAESITAEVELIQYILRRRERDGQDIPLEWVREHVGKSNADLLLTHFRTGQGLPAGETLDLPTYADIEIGDRVFTGRAMSYDEALVAAAKIDEADVPGVVDEAAQIEELQAEGLRADETVSEYLKRLRDASLATLKRANEGTRLTAQLIADLLNTRIADGRETIDGGWLLDLLQRQDINAISHYLRTGSMPEPEDDGDAPNADADGGASS